MIEGKNLLQDETHSSLTEAFVEEQQSRASLLKKIAKLNIILKLTNRKNKKNEK